MTGARDQFCSLDCLRGIAALGVMLFHAPIIGPQIMPGGYLAVDLFFLISGFVITHAYREKMLDGMSVRSFLYRRAIRLWPMLALGAFLGIILFGGHAGSLFLLPNPKSLTNLFPANPPLWSLFLEALAYIIFALGLWRLHPRMIILVTLTCAIVLSALAYSAGPIVDFGAHWHTFGAGIARTGFGFCAGIALWHFWHQKQPKRRKTKLAWLLPIVVIAIMALAKPESELLNLAAILIAFPIIGWLALCWEIPQLKIAQGLGNLSYPLYCIHVPLLVWLAANSTVTAIALFFILPCISLLLERYADRPIRAWLFRTFDQASKTKPRPASA